MNREIKLRAWCPKNKEMYYPDGHYEFWIDNNSIGFYPRYEQEAFSSYNTVASESEEKILVMQSTGLKDKSVKDIYEGDILDYDERIRGFVKYTGCSFIIEWVGIDTYSDLLGWDNWRSGKVSDGSKYEVIGNIYQNPELLKP